MGGAENLEILSGKIDALKESVDAIWAKINAIGHVLYEGNGQSLTTVVGVLANRVQALEARCGSTCPMASRMVMMETQLGGMVKAADSDAEFRRKVGIGLIIAAATGTGSLILGLVMALARLGVRV